MKTAQQKLDEHKKREEFLSIGIIVCETCWGKGYIDKGFKAIEECEACGGTGGEEVEDGKHKQ